MHGGSPPAGLRKAPWSCSGGQRSIEGRLVLGHEPRLGGDAVLHVPDVDALARYGCGCSHHASTMTTPCSSLASMSWISCPNVPAGSSASCAKFPKTASLPAKSPAIGLLPDVCPPVGGGARRLCRRLMSGTGPRGDVMSTTAAPPILLVEHDEQRKGSHRRLAARRRLRCPHVPRPVSAGVFLYRQSSGNGLRNARAHLEGDDVDAPRGMMGFAARGMTGG